jgi:Domain of Unknown Function with PDB structure (DUF3857)/Transglutaminase-like superfamily
VKSRFFVSLGTAAIFCMAIGFAAVPAWAGEKKLPVPDWALEAAKTTTPVVATATNAPAVVLFDEYLVTVDGQNHAVERERYAVRILKPQGRGYAHCAAYYDVDSKLQTFHTWTIAADGKQFQAKDEDYVDHGLASDLVLQFTERERTVNPPGADPGAVVACETETQMRPYMTEEVWDIQHSIPVVTEALELALPPGGHYSDSWRGREPMKPTETPENHLRWEIHDMPALDLENVRSAPSWGALAARMSVNWGTLAVKGTEEQWRAIGEWMGGLEEHRTDPTPEITAKTQELTAGAPDLYTKLERITDYIQKNVRYFVVETGIGGWQAHWAGDIYRNKYGDCKDKTTLLISMLQAVGVKAYYLHVDTRRGYIDPKAPSLYGNHMITAIELPAGENDPRLMARVKTAGPDKTGGKELLIFDPTDEWTPVGLIRAELQGAYGNIADGENSQALRMPVLPASSGGVAREGKFALAEDGSLSGELEERRTGDDAQRQRISIKYSDAKELREEIERRLGADLPGLAFKDYQFASIADLDKPLDLTMKISATNYAHSAGPLLLLRPRVLGSHVHTVPDVMDGKLRLYPIVLGHPGTWKDSFDITLPAGYAVDDTPEPVSVDVDFASYKSTVTAKGSTLHYESEYVVRDVEIPPAKAAEFRKLEQAILASEKGAAVLKKQ